jgi:hypothetical protein
MRRVLRGRREVGALVAPRPWKAWAWNVKELDMAEMTPLSDETRARIEALTKKISVAEGLDAEVREELRGHVEDKVRGYVSGAERPSEADAVILATAHFGEPGVIQGMFQRVHAGEHGMSLLRRMCVGVSFCDEYRGDGDQLALGSALFP